MPGAWPIGIIYITILPENPYITFGFGTWVKLSEGRFIVSEDSTDADFTPVEKTGGSKF